MDALKRISLALLCLAFLPACQISYYVKSAYNHFSMMSRRVSLDEAIRDPKTDPKVRTKLILAQEAHDFAIQKVGLKKTNNYTTYVDLGRPYVSWVISAAPRWRLEHHQWSYPIVGKMPYKGFASEDDAKEEQNRIEAKDLDTFLRGVSAYSTLGWFQDSVLSSMLRAEEHDLVNTLIHETVHATLYIKNSADFNERLAVFVGNRATEQFYLSKEGPDSPTLKTIQAEYEDDRAFSDFIGPQLAKLKAWYEELPESRRDPEIKKARLRQIQEEFKTKVLPNMKTKTYRRFPEIELNNARLLFYKTYMQDLSVFDQLYQKTNSDWGQFLACARTLEKAPKPEDALLELISRLAPGGGC